MSVGFKLAEAYIDIKANNLMAEVLTGAVGQIRGLGAAEGEAEGAAGRLGSTGKLALIGIGAAAVGGAVELVKMAGDFQASTVRLVTSAGEAQSNLDMVRQGILGLAGDVGYSAEELSAAMYKVESGGQHGADGLTVLKAAAQGAKAENADLTTVSDALTSAMQDYHAPASQAADITSKLVAATSQGKMTFEELAGSMSAILPVASANHVSLNDILGDLASMTVHGMSAQQASQNLADAVRHLAAPTQVSQKELSLLGFTSQQISADLGQKGLSGTVAEIGAAIEKGMGPGSQQVVLSLKTALQGLSPQVQDLGEKLLDGSISQKDYTKATKELTPELAGQASQFATLAKSTHGIGNEQMSGAQVMQTYSGAMKAAMGDATGMNVALMLTGENSATTANAIKVVSGATADAAGNVKGWDEIQSTFNTKIDRAKDGLGALAISIGTKLLPIVTPVVGAFADMAQWVSQNQSVALGLAIVIGGVVTVAFAAAAVAAWSFTAALLANPATWIIVGIVAAIGLLVAAAVWLVNNWQGVTAFFAGLWHGTTDVFNAAMGWIGSALTWLQNLPATVLGWLQGLPYQIGYLLGSLIGILLKVGIDSLTSMAHGIATGAVAVFDFAVALPGRVVGFLIALPGMLLSFGISALHALASGATTGGSAVISFIVSLPGRIVSGLGDLGSLLINAGKAVISGLLQGIENAVGGLMDFVGGIADGIAAHKGPIEYDRTVLIPHGNAFMDGLLEGLKSGHARVLDFVGGVAGDIANTLPTDMPMNVSVAGAYSASAAAAAANGALTSSSMTPDYGGSQGGRNITVNVQQIASNPMETGRLTALALRTAS